MLSGAVVLEPRRFDTALEIVLGCLRLREQAAHRVELLRTMEVRRAGNGYLRVVEIRPHANQRQCLERFRSAPKVGDERGVAARLDDLPVGDGYRVNVVPGFNHTPTKNLDDDRFHGA